ncbi:MAG: hypothetical protein LC660_14445 [Desulfobacteraceae bacterium]|nr:hypothetical protein [Desulfobacteraceae bacterium]
MVSCERTVRAVRGLIQYAGPFTVREWIAIFDYSHRTWPLKDLGPGTGCHQGRSRRQSAAANSRPPWMLPANEDLLAFR